MLLFSGVSSQSSLKTNAIKDIEKFKPSVTRPVWSICKLRHIFFVIYAHHWFSGPAVSGISLSIFPIHVNASALLGDSRMAPILWFGWFPGNSIMEWRQSMRRLSIVLIVGIVFGAWSATSLAETMRCGSDYIQIDDSEFIVEEKCGEPVSKIHMGYTITENGKRELVIKEWVYGPVKSYYYFVTITGGHVTAIRSERP
jgi:hypothetical protein